MTTNHILGLILLVVGICLLYMGYNATQHAVDQAVEMATGKYTENTMIYLLSGIVLSLSGLTLLFLRKS